MVPKVEFFCNVGASFFFSRKESVQTKNKNTGKYSYQKVMLTSFLNPFSVAVIFGSANANSLNSSKES